MPFRRTLSLTTLVALTFFCVAGGAYGIEDAVGAAGPLLALLAMLMVPWLWSFPTALMTAELSAAMPEAGGYVVWVERAFGRFWGFQEGWLSWLCSFADNALYPLLFVEYLTYLHGGMTAFERWLIGAAVIAVIAWFNIRGTQLVGISSVVFTVLVLAPFAVMVVWGAPRVAPSAWLAGTDKIDWGVLLSVVLWNTCGWDNAGCCAGEVIRPTRTYPRAMAATVVLVTLVYLLPMAVGIGVDSHWSDWKTGSFPKVGAQIGGGWLGTWLMVAGMVGAFGSFNALLCTSSRVSYAMAARQTLPAPLARVHARYATPWVAILVSSVGIAGLLPFSFKDLVQVDMCLYALALILEFAALVWLRFTEPTMPRPYSVPFGRAGAIALSVPPIALAAASMVLSDTLTKLLSIGGIAMGLLVYGAFRRWGKGL
jgi:amino acid transporter